MKRRYMAMILLAGVISLSGSAAWAKELSSPDGGAKVSTVDGDRALVVRDTKCDHDDVHGNFSLGGKARGSVYDTAGCGSSVSVPSRIESRQSRRALTTL